MTWTVEEAAALGPARVDREQMRRLLTNLIDNAVEATAGKGHVVIRLAQRAGPGSLRLEVEDDGRGVPPDKRGRFDVVEERTEVKKAVFFDRDGTLCKDPGYLRKIEDFEVFPEVSSLAGLKEKGFCLIGITNQSGIARGLVDEAFRKTSQRCFSR